MDHKGNTICFSTLTAIVKDEDLDSKVSDMRAAEARLVKLQGQLHDAEIEAQELRSDAFNEAREILKSDADIAHTYATEAW